MGIEPEIIVNNGLVSESIAAVNDETMWCGG